MFDNFKSFEGFFPQILLRCWQILNLFWSEPCWVMSLYESKIQDIPKKM